jgi:membrane-associated protein
MSQFIDIFLHLDVHLSNVITTYGTSTYFILFFVVFCETGLVITPFLPGDSLLFAAGTFAALGALNVWLVLLFYCLAAIIGDTVNYWVGRNIGLKVFNLNIPFLKKDYVDRTEYFYKKHGRKTVVLARFIPIIRTFAPFVAGLGRMPYGVFLTYSIGGTLAWVNIFVWGGYFFGNIPIIKENFTIAIFAVIGISILPGIIKYIHHLVTRNRPTTKLTV